MKKLTYILLALPLLLLAACNLQKDVDVKLPPFKSILVVESYIQRGQPLRVAVTQSQDYFAPTTTNILDSVFVNDATVNIIYRGDTINLKFNPVIDPKELKLFNYSSPDTLNLVEGEPIYLQVLDKRGRSVSAQTQWINPVKIDSVKPVFNGNDTTGLLVGYFRDKGPETDYYRFRVRRFRDTVRTIVDYYTDDAVFNNQSSAFGTQQRFKHGDTAEVTLYTIPREYYRFLTTANQAASANGNPFGQTAVIETNIVGGTGIFTVLPFDRKRFVVP